MLSDGRWHTLEEIQRKAEIDEVPLRRTVDFLNEYEFIMMDEAGKRAKLNKLAQEFLAQTPTA